MNPSTRSGLRLIPDFKQPTTWRGIAGLLAMFGISASPDLTHAICILLGAVLSAIEVFRNEYFDKLSNNAASPKEVFHRRESAKSADAAFPGSPVAAEQLREPSTELRPRPVPPANDPTDDLPPPPGFSNR